MHFFFSERPDLSLIFKILLLLDIVHQGQVLWCILSVRITSRRSFWTGFCWFHCRRVTCTLLHMFSPLLVLFKNANSILDFPHSSLLFLLLLRTVREHMYDFIFNFHSFMRCMCWGTFSIMHSWGGIYAPPFGVFIEEQNCLLHKTRIARSVLES